uniref:Sugar phosphate transporter domain-containing protein n=1 Tax=Cuerna arida TaxID=1464854 RepID=A0A1B6H1W7_9HEMI
MDKHLKLLFYSGGIFICYFYYGLVQERITRGVYGKTPETQEKFKCILALVFVQCVVNWIYAHFLLKTFMKQGENLTSTFYLCSSALTYFLAMVCSNMALQWVSYPTQVIGKSGKPIPVMILGVLLGKKSYPVQKYFFVLLVVIGVALFMFKDGQTSATSTDSVGIGEMLLVLSLTMDGITAAIQERMRTEYKTKSLHMMSSINKWSIIFLGIAIAYTGEIFDFISFIQRHPSLLWELVSFSFASAQGQLFIFLMVEHFGPLPCSIVTTTRKFFTVFGSIIFFGNSMTSRQWIATFIVFTGLLLDSLYGKKAPAKVVNKS